MMLNDTNDRNLRSHLKQSDKIHPDARCANSGDLFVATTAFVISIIDLLTDVVTGILYFILGDHVLGSLTFLFISISLIVLQVFSARLFLINGQWHHQPARRWTTHLLLLEPLERFVFVLMQWPKVKQQSVRAPYCADCWFLHQNNDACMLRFFGVFLGSAPQLTLQAYVIYMHGHGWLPVVSSCVSLFAIGWAVACYHYTHNRAMGWNHCRPPNACSFVLQMFAHIFIVASRIAAIIAFSSVFDLWILVIIGAHCVASIIWNIIQKTNCCASRLDEILFACITGFVSCFCFVNFGNGPIRCQLITFHAIYFVENAAAVCILWFIANSNGTVATTVTMSVHFELVMSVVIGGSFILGISCLLLYFCAFNLPAHPILCRNNSHIYLSAAAGSEIENIPPMAHSTDDILTSTGILPRRCPKQQTSHIVLTRYTPLKLLSPIRHVELSAANRVASGSQTPTYVDMDLSNVDFCHGFQHYSIDASACLQESFLLPATLANCYKISATRKPLSLPDFGDGVRQSLNLQVLDKNGGDLGVRDESNLICSSSVNGAASFQMKQNDSNGVEEGMTIGMHSANLIAGMKQLVANLAVEFPDASSVESKELANYRQSGQQEVQQYRHCDDRNNEDYDVTQNFESDENIDISLGFTFDGPSQLSAIEEASPHGGDSGHCTNSSCDLDNVNCLRGVSSEADECQLHALPLVLTRFSGVVCTIKNGKVV